MKCIFCVGKTLKSCTKEDIDADLIKETSTTLMTFDDWNENSKKRKPLTPVELFAKMLMCQSGVTAKMALAIVDAYPSPGALMSAYDKCADKKERDLLLTKIEIEEGRKIGKTISEVIACLYNETELN